MNNQIFDLDMFCAKRDVAQQRFAGFETTASEIVAAYTAGERNFCYADLARANLTDTNLYGANLTGADLTRADLARANLTDTNLTGANLYGANLYGANLTDTNLTDTNLYGANLYGANLYGANLTGANLTRANLTRANLTRADLARADLARANLTDTNLTDTNLTDTNLTGANLTRANLTRACGLYSVFAPHLSSRRASLFGGLGIEGGVVQLRFWAGCKMYITAETLRKHVAKTHGDNNYARQYEAAIRFIETCFEIDMAAHKWDYLLNWTSPQQS